MRRILLAMVFFAIATSLGDCDFSLGTAAPRTTTWTDGEPGPRTVEGVSVTGDAGMADIDILGDGIDPAWLDYTIDGIHVDVLLSTITVDFTIVDDMAKYYEYYWQMRLADGWGHCVNKKQIQLQETASYTLVYPWIEGTDTYRFMIVKWLRNTDNDREVIEKATSGFTIRIPAYDDRRHLVGDAGFSFENESATQTAFPYTLSGRTIVSGSFSFVDPALTVTEATVHAYEIGTERLVYTQSFEITAACVEDGRCRFRGWHVDGLSPHVEYRFDLYVSGSDGVDPFVDRFLASRVLETDRFWGTVDSAHGMYAYLVPRGLDYNGFRFHVFLAYDGLTTATGGGEPITFWLRFRDEDSAIVHEEPIEAMGFSTYDYGNQFVGIGHVVSVESESGDIVLCRDDVPFVAPNVNVYYRSFTVPESVSISFHPNDGVLVEGWVEITQGDVLLLRYELPSQALTDAVILTLEGVEFYGPQLMAWIYYEYTAFDGHDIVTVDGTGPA